MLKYFDIKNYALKPIFMNNKIWFNIKINSINIAGNPLFEIDKECYQQGVESLLYLLLEIRLDIFFAVMILSWFMTNPHEKHESALNWIFCYLRNTLDVGIIYYAAKSPIPTGFTRASSVHVSPVPTEFTDASFVYFIVIEGRCFTSGYIFFMAGRPVSWSSKY